MSAVRQKLQSPPNNASYVSAIIQARYLNPRWGRNLPLDSGTALPSQCNCSVQDSGHTNPEFILERSERTHPRLPQKSPTGLVYWEHWLRRFREQCTRITSHAKFQEDLQKSFQKWLSFFAAQSRLISFVEHCTAVTVVEVPHQEHSVLRCGCRYVVVAGWLASPYTIRYRKTSS